MSEDFWKDKKADDLLDCPDFDELPEEEKEFEMAEYARQGITVEAYAKLRVTPEEVEKYRKFLETYVKDDDGE